MKNIEYPILDRSYDFAVRIVRLNKYLNNTFNEKILSSQILRSGTSIGANVCEATRGQSKRDFISKMNIALKESYETQYWLKLLKDGEYITSDEFNSLHADNQVITNIIAKIILTSKQNIDE